MRTIFDFDNMVVHKDATLVYDEEHHLLRETLFRELAEYYQPDPTGERTILLKQGDLTIGDGALCAEQVPISQVDILPDEHEFRGEDVLTALNEAPVLALHLQRTKSDQLRQELRAVSQAVATMRWHDRYPYVVATSYRELIRLAVRGAGMHPATVQCASKYTVAAGKKHWKEYAAQNYHRVGTDQNSMRTYALTAAFMSTVEFGRICDRL